MFARQMREPALNAKVNLTAKATRLVLKKINAKNYSALQWVRAKRVLFAIFYIIFKSRKL